MRQDNGKGIEERKAQTEAIRAIQAQDRDGVQEVLRNALEQAAKTGATGIILVLANEGSVACWTRTSRTSSDVGLRTLGMAQVACNQMMGLTMAPRAQAPAPEAPAPPAAD